ncbi:MAG: hypothetical protein K0S09_1618 [Sphingobacteriaceae bacterium]|nr:hypothetical protein [Sphingobacteriaceae bacterium]
MLLASALCSCKKEKTSQEGPPVSQPVQNETISGDITANTTLSENTNYTLKGRVFVKNNAVLTIPAGTTIKVEPSSATDSKGALIIARGAKININGTSDKPVVFTSAATAKAPGDWAGIIVLGKATTNGPAGILRVQGLPSTADTEFGGNTDNDNSGVIRYLRVEYAGGLNPLNEPEWAVDMPSGLSLQGVGSGTTIENVMVKHSRDDAFQFVGGTVNAKYLIAYKNGDDNFDFDRGYTGKLQFLISYNPTVSFVALRAHGVESLNDENASDILPYTRPIISNMTIIGPEGTDPDATHLSQGIYIRKNTRFNIQNSIIAGYSSGGLMLCPKTKPILVNNFGSYFRFNIVNSDNPDRAFTYDTGGDGNNIIPDPEVANYAVQMDDNTIAKPSVSKNKVSNTIGEIKLQGLYTANPNFSPASGSEALSGGNLGGADFQTFFTQVTYRGAVGTDNWASAGTWINWQ